MARDKGKWRDEKNELMLIDRLLLAGCGGEILVTGLWQTLTNSKIGECYWKLYVSEHKRRSNDVVTSTFHLGGGRVGYSHPFVPFQTPTGKIHFEVLESNYKCDSSCADNYLEIKHTSKLEQTGFRSTPFLFTIASQKKGEEIASFAHSLFTSNPRLAAQ